MRHQIRMLRVILVILVVQIELEGMPKVSYLIIAFNLGSRGLCEATDGC